MQRFPHFPLVALPLLAAAIAIGAPVPATAPGSPRAIVDQVTQQAVAVMADTTLKAEQKHQKVMQLANDNLDFSTLAKLSLGLYWRDLDAAKRAQFVPEFKQHITNTYAHLIDQYTDEQVNVTGERHEPDGDDTVLTSIIGDKDGKRQEVAKVEYRLRKQGDAWKIIDVTIDSISLATNFRSQFQEIMSNGGIDKLIQLLHDKNAAASAENK